MYTLTRQEILALLAEDDKSLLPASDNPFATDEWLRHWIGHVARDDWDFCLPDSPRDSLSMLFCRERTSRTLRLLANYYTILAPATFGDISGLPEMVRRFRGLDFELRPLSAEDPATLALERALVSSRWYVRRTPAFGNWYLPCQGLGFDAYLAERPSQLRNTLKRKAKRFPGTIEVCIGTDGLERAIEAYQRVYLRSWKRPEPYPDFVPEWMRICAKRGRLRLATAWLGDVPIAAQFWFVYASRAHIYKLAYDEDHREHSAGTILTARLMQHVLDIDRVMEIDYGSGDDGYKRDWMTRRRERIVLTARDLTSLRGLLRATRERLAEATAPLRALVGARASASTTKPAR